MNSGWKLAGVVVAGVLCLPVAGRADTQTAPHKAHKAATKKPEIPSPPPPLPSGPQGPVPQVPLDAMPAVAPQVSYQDGLLTIVAPNSTLADILRSVHKHTSAEIEVPANASERVVTRLGPAPARQVMAELLNGSRFNYILLGSAENANQLVRVVLVPKSGDTSNPQEAAESRPGPQTAAAEPSEGEVPEDPIDETPDTNTAEEQPASPADQPVRTPQQMLQEMQQRQMQMQQGQQPGQPPFYPGRPGIPPQPQQPQPQQQQDQ